MRQKCQEAFALIDIFSIHEISLAKEIPPDYDARCSSHPQTSKEGPRMERAPKPSFEILHLIATLLVKLESVFENCQLNASQLYVLGYIDSHGKTTRGGQRVLLRTTITKVLKEVFKCNDTQVSVWVNELLTLKLLGETTLGKEERAQLSLVMKGSRGKALFVERKGSTMLSFLVTQLIKFRRELTKDNSKLLHSPGTERGPVASALAFFLAAYDR
jgi:hypothetical protein